MFVGDDLWSERSSQGSRTLGYIYSTISSQDLSLHVTTKNDRPITKREELTTVVLESVGPKEALISKWRAILQSA